MTDRPTRPGLKPCHLYYIYEMDFQIRLRTDELFSNIVYIQHWLDAAREGFAFNHNKPGNNHYHIYLFGLDRKPDPMRKYLAKYLPNKESYSVKTTAGKNKEPIKAHIAYQYGTEAEAREPVWIKGYSDQDIEVFKFDAACFYDQMAKRQERKKQVVTEILVLNEEKVKPDRVWENLMNELIERPDMYDDKAVPHIKSMIAASYLRKLKAVPRPSDLHRYAVSLYYIVRHDLHRSEHATIPEMALLEEYSK